MTKEQYFLQERLEEIGWMGQTEIDITKLCQDLTKLNYHTNDLQREFLKKYANVEFTFSNPKLKGRSINDLIKLRNPEHKFNSDLEGMYILSFNPLDAANSILRYVVEEYEYNIGKKMLIIGQLANENISLFISEDGHFYGGFDENLIEYGDYFEKMVYDIMTDDN